MATYTSNYGWTKPSGSDNVDISVLNGNLDDQDSTIHDAFLNMAPPFSESSTYAVDDIVLYGTGLYKCHTAVVTPGSWTGSTNWQVYKLSEGDGGGGTSDYTQLTNKPSINSVELSGNKTSANLSLQNASTEITWAQWIQKTPQEQETGDWRITDCPWADGDVSVDLMTQLWQNPSPSASFAAQDIVMDFSDYNCVFLVADGATIILSKNAIMTITVTPISAGGKVLRRLRTAKLHDAKITISDCTERIINTYGSAASDTTANNELVPRYIYGIKTTASVKINAIAMDVSTSADKCMLSDGVTSVEDAIECTQTTAGNYRLRATVSAGGAVTYSWVAE